MSTNNLNKNTSKNNSKIENDSFQDEPKQVFTGYWIPKELSKLGLTPTEQFLLSMIDSLEGDAPEYCFASNAYLAKKMDLSESRISYYITKFKRLELIEEVEFNGRRRRLRVLKHNWYREKIENKKHELKNSKKELCVNSRSLPTRVHVVCLRENTQHIINTDNKDDIIITPQDDPPKIPDKPIKQPIPAGGNNNNSSIEEVKKYKCLEKCIDLSTKQKLQLCKYPEPVVEKAVKYCYHEKIKLRGPQARIKQLHDFCKNPELYEDTFKNLDNPNGHKNIKDLITSSLKNGERYNGADFYYDDKGMSFHLINSMYPYELTWKDADFNNKFIELCKKLKLSIKLFPGIENFL